ncbi:uncharacterized protein [Clytia hemisphaerica]|uniref:SWIM-type domain-containing protein n=1 Tax=Clytia hemisphaerica TaxID=252671 RepID=A0A7M5VBI8_9CNID
MAENLEKNIISQENGCNTSIVSSTSDGHFRSQLLLGEGQIDAQFDEKLKEEIAAQTLILTALGNGENNGTSGSSQTSTTVHLHQEGDHVFVSTDNDGSHVSNNVLVATQNVDDFHQQDQQGHSFDVSQAIGVEMIAIQQNQSDSKLHQQLDSHVGTILTRENPQDTSSDINQCGYKAENREENDLLNRQLAAGGRSMLEASISGGSPVVLNAIAIKGENGVTELQEIQFDATASTSEMQIEHTEVEAITEQDQEEDQTDKAALMIINPEKDSPGRGEIAEEGNQGEEKYPQLFTVSTAEDAHEVIKNYAEETMSTFVSMRKMKQYGITEGGIDLKKKNYRVFFESTDIEFDGIPYVYVADKMYICHLGKDKTEVTRQKIRMQSLERRAKLGLPLKDVSSTRLRTKKIDCPVKITVKMIAKFPQYKVDRKTKRVCETASKKVRQALLDTNGKLNCYYSFIGRLPATAEHNHPVGEDNSEHEPIDQIIKDKIVQLTWEGIVSSGEVKKILEDFVEQELFAGKPSPAKTRRRYYPNVKDIRNYMNKAKMLTRLSTDLKQELQELATKLQQSRPTENIILQSEFIDQGESLLPVNKTVSDDTRSLKPTLIFCHQTSQQQRLLKRYGRQIVLSEVTNLIERVPFPLFNLFVQTNVDYQLVASFIVEVRNRASILQGLNTVKDWNPGWVPKYIVIDYSDDQSEAVKEVFPSSQQFISEASRERCWRQWLSKPENKISGDPNKVFLQFQAIANSFNEEVLHQAALELENSEIWRESANLRSWFNSNWLLEAKKWVIGYRPDDFIVTLHNDFLIERDERTLRDAHMSFMRGKKLGTLIENLVNTVIPGFYKRYIELNRKSYTQANELKVLYGDQLPTCLVNKPASVIVHVLEQIKTTESTVYQVSHVQPGVFWVQDASATETSDAAHTVSFGDANNLPSCDCLDWQQYKLPCKHLCSVFSSFPEWGWDMLNASYTANPLINLDYSCIKPWVDGPHKEEQRLSHYNVTPSLTLNADEPKVSPKQTTINANDIKISDVELEVPAGSKEGSAIETSVKTGNEKSASSLVADTEADTEDEETADIALQCRDLLTNLAQLTSKRKHDQIAKLKADLEASIRILQETVEQDEIEEGVTTKVVNEEKPAVVENCVTGQNNTTPNDENILTEQCNITDEQANVIIDHGNVITEQALVVGEQVVTNDGISLLATGSKRVLNTLNLDEEDEVDDFKRLRVDLDKESDIEEGSYVSEEEDPIGAPVSTDIEDETVEISTEHEDDDEDNELLAQTPIHEPEVPDVILNADVPIQTILTRPPPVEELTPEQRERKLLAILTASSV